MVCWCMQQRQCLKACCYSSLTTASLFIMSCCSVFTCKLQSKTLDQYGTSHVRTSRLHLVDLAGK